MGAFSVLVADGCGSSPSSPGRFIPGERSAGVYWTLGWVDPRTGLVDVRKRKYLVLPVIEISFPVFELVVYVSCLGFLGFLYVKVMCLILSQ
jgi:hypothetical protein